MINSTPNQKIRELYASRSSGWIAFVSLLLFLLFSFVFFNVTSLMHRAANDSTVIHLQLAFSASKFKAILVKWSETFDTGIEIFKISVILLDYIFPVIYAMLLAFTYAWVRRNNEPTKVDRWLFIAPFLACLFDWFENSLHLYILRHVHNRIEIENTNFSNSLVCTASIFASAKLLIIIIVFLAIITAIAFRLTKRE